MQARMVLALVDLTEGPIEKVAGLASANGEVAGADIEKMQRMVAAIGDTAAKRVAAFHDGEAERPLDPGDARDGGRRAGEATTDDAHCSGVLRISFPLQVSLALKPHKYGIKTRA